MRKPIMAGNWKMYKTVPEAVALVESLKKLIAGVNHTEVVVCPPYVALTEVAKILRGSDIRLGAQNVYFEDEGAFTGELSVGMLKSAGVTHVIIGHSERRAYFHETNETVNKKLKKVLLASLTPIVCVGELLAEREKGETQSVVRAQLEGSLQGLTKEDLVKTVIAYEPVWAIGTGKTATPLQAEEVHDFIRKELNRNFGGKTAEEVRIQYGGSVKPGNIDELMREKDIDGALVGGASLKAEDFARIVKFEVPEKHHTCSPR